MKKFFTHFAVDIENGERWTDVISEQCLIKEMKNYQLDIEKRVSKMDIGEYISLVGSGAYGKVDIIVIRLKD